MQSCQRTKTKTKTSTRMTTSTAGRRRRQLMRIANANANALNNKSQFSPQIAVGQKRSSNILLERRQNGNGANKRTPLQIEEGKVPQGNNNWIAVAFVPCLAWQEPKKWQQRRHQQQTDKSKRYRGRTLGWGLPLTKIAIKCVWKNNSKPQLVYPIPQQLKIYEISEYFSEIRHPLWSITFSIFILSSIS